jgi:hypothetical protein
MRTTTSTGALLAAALLASCGGEAATLLRLEISPPVTEVTEHLHADATVTAVMDDGTSQDVTAQATWWTVDQAVATISGGRVRGDAPGGTYLVAAWGGLQVSARVQVLPAVLLSLRVTAEQTVLPAGVVTHVEAWGDFSDWTTRNVTGDVEWSSRPADAACQDEEEQEEEDALDVDDEGHLHGHYECALTLVASLAGRTTSLPLQVIPAEPAALALVLDRDTLPLGAHAHVRVEARLTDGSTLDVTREAVLEIDGAVAGWDDDGVLQGVGVGTTAVVATWQAWRTSGRLDVTAAELRSIQVIPPAEAVAPGRLLYFTAAGSYTDGTVRDLTASLTWTTSSDVFAVSYPFIRPGAILARAAGTATVYASDPTTGLVSAYLLVIPRS